MQNQLFRGLFISLFALTLSACVGAVNIGGTSPQDTLINRCIVGNTAQSDPTCAKAVADTNGCITNPFLSGCEANPVFSRHVQNAKDERVKFCNDNQRDNRCTDSIKDICTHDPFSVLCNYSYDEARKSICEDSLTFPRCTDTLIKVCNRDPFNTDFCFQDSSYNRLRNATCERLIERTSARCADSVIAVCDNDAFKTLCGNNPTYEKKRGDYCIIGDNADEPRCKNAFNIYSSCVLEPFTARCGAETAARSARETFCRQSINTRNRLCDAAISYFCRLDSLDVLCHGRAVYYPAQKKACTDDNTNPICAEVITRTCDADALDALCNGVTEYFTEQKKACRRESDFERCAPIIVPLTTWVCDKNSLDVLCYGNKAYFTEQRKACPGTSFSSNTRCYKAIFQICDKTPFDTFCQSRTLRSRDIPFGSFGVTGGNSQKELCSYYIDPNSNRYYTCLGLTPDDIGVQPLNNTNTGTATYAGTVSLEFVSDSNVINKINNKSIDIIANFGNNTLSYSGNLSPSSNPFNINGNFTDRGILTGTVNLNGTEAPLVGLIGQIEIIGIFSNHRGYYYDSPFGGGFTATRE